MIIVTTLSALSATVFAVDIFSADQALIHSGQTQFEKNCTSCHNAEATGKMDKKNGVTIAPDLTQIAKKNDGIFPMWQIYDVIYGKKAGAAHQARKMPIWGDELVKSRSVNKESREAIVRGRILAIIAYLSTIQAK